MPLLDIASLPDPCLRRVCEPVDVVDEELLTLMEDMLETMYEAQGVGLAASQVGVLRRVVVIDVTSGNVAPCPVRMINPRIVSLSEEGLAHEEGCLSIPGFRAEIIRPAVCTVRFTDERGEERTLKCEDLMATVVQHEIDHLDGILFIDYLSKLKRDRVLRKYEKLSKRQHE